MDDTVSGSCINNLKERIEMRYPINQASSIPGSGSAVYLHLLNNINLPARLPHELWYNGQAAKLDDEHDPFKGFPPKGRTLKMSYGGSVVQDYTFTGEEKNPIFVKDLSPEAMLELGLPKDANPADKVFNPNFCAYEDLPDNARISNETASMSLAKSISSFLCTKMGITYTEKDIVEMLLVSIDHADSQEMRHILHGNHVSWCAARFIETGVMEEDIKRQFYGQNDIDFYVKDIGTIMPSMLFTLAILGVDPVEMIKKLDYDLWGIDEVAEKLQGYMKKNQKEEIKNVA